MKKHVNIRVRGLVQGVSFRVATKTKAQDFGVNGFVRNEPDGSVYIQVEGEEADVDEFIIWCKSGPPRAQVEKIEVDQANVIGVDGFSIQQ